MTENGEIVDWLDIEGSAMQVLSKLAKGKEGIHDLILQAVVSNGNRVVA